MVSKLLKERWLRLAFAADSTTVIAEEKDPYDSCWDGYERVPGKKKDEKGSCRKKEGSDPMGDEGNNLWDNIRAKDERIKKGSGEKKAKPGDPDYPATLDVNEYDETLSETDENAFVYAIASEKAKDPTATSVEIDGEEVDIEMSHDTAKEIVGDETDEAIEEAITRWQNTVNESGFDKAKKDKMKCNSPRYLAKGEPGHGNKQKVVKACDPDSDKEKIIKFGDANMKNKSNVKANRENFRKRHNCADKNMAKDWDTNGYWACKDW